jgi:hypothetical protein
MQQVGVVVVVVLLGCCCRGCGHGCGEVGSVGTGRCNMMRWHVARPEMLNVEVKSVHS